MKRKFTYSFLTALMCLAGLNAWALDQKDGVYQIGTAADLAEFANVINTQNRFANAVLTADIDYTTQFVQIARATGNVYRQAFAGVFDGQGHKITVDIPAGDAEGDAALFGANAGVIKNLVVDGKIAVPKKYAGAIVGYNDGTVSHCVSLVDFTSTLAGDNTAGGVVGAGYYNSIIDHCVFAGTVTGADATNWGGISGWLNKQNVTNCLNIGTFDINITAGNSFPIIRSADSNNIPGRIRNNLYADTWGSEYANAGSQAITADQIANGYAAYVLGMGQKLGTDAYPSPISTDRVYPKGSCDPALAAGFTNNAAEAAQHSGGAVCSVCGMVNPDFVTADADGFYPIANAEQLDWFASMVNSGEVTINGKLTADIDMSSLTDFQMIGTDSASYAGTFDGQYHKISNMTITRPNLNNPCSINIGLFGSIGGQNKIKNILLDETCSVTAYQHVGGLIGHGTQAGSWNEVEGVISYATVAAYPAADGGASDAGVGGIVGNYNDVCYGKMTNCAFLGKVSGTSSAHLSGWFGNTQDAGCPPGIDHTFQYTVTGCWSVAEKPSETALSQCFGRAGGSGVNVKYNYCAAIAGDQVPNITTEDIAGGGLAWAITDPENPGWFQKLGTDPMPTLKGSDIVYKVGTKNCDGTDGAGYGFSNENTGFTQLPHQVDPASGLCTVCGQWIPSEDGWYDISNIETFLRFAELAKTDATIKGRLTADLDFTGVDDSWAPIGSDKTFVGVFDGQNHIISNMVLDEIDKSDFGMFKTGTNVVLKNFIVDASCSITGAQKVGLIGNHNGGGALFENIGSMASVSGEGENVSGFFGGGWSASTPVTVNSCWVVGDISTGNRDNPKNPANCGCFGGWLNSGTFIFNNCWTIAKVNNTSNNGRFFTRHNDSYPPQLNNCYSLIGTQVKPIPGFSAVDAGSSAEAIDAVRESVLAELATGGLAFRLNGDQTTINWYQTIGEDICPVPWTDHKRVYAEGPVLCNGVPQEGATFTNTPNDNQSTHDYENGFCNNCGTIDTDYKPLVNGAYELETAEDIFWFATMVEQIDKKINGRLTANIDMSSVNDKFQPIGWKAGYGGTFDGDYHTVSNFVINNETKDDQGFIGSALTGMTLKNILFDGSCSITGGKYAGIVAANPSTEKGDIYLINIGNEGSVRTVTGVNAGGILGCNHGSGAIYHISNCFSTGYVESTSESGAIAGWMGSSGGEISSCWSTAEVVNPQAGREMYRWGTTAPTASNIYSTIVDCGQGSVLTEETVKSGELAWKLNGEKFLDVTWYQTIGMDDYPVFLPDHGLVYKVGDVIGDVHDDPTYFEFRSLVIADETAVVEESVACQDVLDAYQTEIEKWEEIETLDEFLVAYRESLTAKKAVTNSIAAYQAYIEACEFAINYFAENEFTNETRTKLETYLSTDAEPSEEFENGTYLYIIRTHTLTDKEIADETAYLNLQLQTAISGGMVPGTEFTVTLANYDFTDGFNGWDVETTNGGMATGGEKSILTVARGLNTEFSVSQTITDLPEGIYMFSVNGFNNPGGDYNSEFYTGQLFLNDNFNYLMVAGEDVVSKDDAVDGENCHITGSSVDREYITDEIEGWVPNYMVGCSYAYKAGRYLNYTAVEVKDGTLTLGVRNPGSGVADDWVPFSNVRVFYLGTAEEASEALNVVLDSYVARAVTVYNLLWLDTDEVALYPNMSEDLKDAVMAAIEERGTVETGAQKMALINKFSELFQQVYDCRRAYAEMIQTAFNTQDNAGTLIQKGIINEDTYSSILLATEEAIGKYQEGSVDTDKALSIIEELESLMPSPEKDENGVYQLASAQDLAIFALLVNTGEYGANAVMTADIDMTGVEFTPIGWNMSTNNSAANTTGALYCGHFDGQGHHISNLVVNFPGSIGVGLFGDIVNPAHIENLVLESSCEIHGKDRAGVIGRADGSGRSGDARIITINNVGNEGNVYADTAPAGILGNANNGSLAIISDCYSTGTITMETNTPNSTDHNAALICGWLANLGAQITNCWSTAEITNYQSVDRALCRVGGDNNIFKNNYSTFATQAYVVPADAFVSGEVTYKLNNGVTTPEATWYQTIGEDQHPTFDRSSQIVFFENGEYINNGSTGETAIKQITADLGNTVSVYDAQGRMVRHNVTVANAVKGMAKGMYILKGEGKSVKVLVK